MRQLAKLFAGLTTDDIIVDFSKHPHCLHRHRINLVGYHSTQGDGILLAACSRCSNRAFDQEVTAVQPGTADPQPGLTPHPGLRIRQNTLLSRSSYE